MRFVIFAFALLCASTAPAAELQPLRADYTVSRDGNAIGTSTSTLTRNPDGSWTLRSETHGTGGMAKLLGLDVREDSTFTLRDGKPQGLRYHYEQNAAIKHKRRSVDFDWNENRAQVRDNGKHFDYAIAPNTIDRSVVAVALGMALAGGAQSMQVPVAVKDRVENQDFAIAGNAVLTLPQGRYDSIEVDRTDAPGKIKSWYALPLGVLPVRVEQKQHDGSVMVMELKPR